MKTANNFKGYTLIELLIGITIISIVFGVGLAGYREFSRRQVLSGATKRMKADLRLAQQLALTGQKPEGSSCPTLNNYAFSKIGASRYTLAANCTNTLGVVLSPIIIKTVDLGSDTTFTAGTFTIRFKVLGQGTDLTTSDVITLTHASGSVSTIVVGVGGDVR